MTAADAPTDRAGQDFRLVRLGGLREYALGPLALTAGVALTPLAAIACTLPAGAEASPVLLAFLPVVALLAGRPGSVGVLATWLLVGVVWLATVPGPFTWWSLPAAAAALLGHLSASFLSTAPTDLTIGSTVVRRYARRCLVVMLVTTTVAVVAASVLHVALAGAEPVVAVAILVVAGWLALARSGQ